MNRLAKVTLSPVAGSANNIGLSQTPGGAGNLTLNGSTVTAGVATLDVARRVVITSAANDSARTFTITGTDRYGAAMTEALAGANAGAATTLRDFLTVSQISVDAATAGAVTVGTSGKVSSQWLPVDRILSQNLSPSVVMSGTANYTVEHTYDDPYSFGVGVLPPGGLVPLYLNPFPNSVLVAQTSSKDGGAYLGNPVTAVRLTLNTFSAGAIVTANFTAGGIMEVF